MKVLLTNDDGYFAEGIKNIYNVLSEDQDVTVIAPGTEQSGVGHGFTYNKTLLFEEVEFTNDKKAQVVFGTPADCIKLGLGYFKNLKPDIIVSGINKGINSGIASFYSGTIAGAREAAFWRIPSIAFSVSDEGFKFIKEYSIIAKRIFDTIFINNKPFIKDRKIFYNVNFPSCKPSLCKGIRITKQSMAYYYDEYDIINITGDKKEVQLRGDIKDIEESLDFDTKAVMSDYISITPLHFDNSFEPAISILKNIEKKLHKSEIL